MVFRKLEIEFSSYSLNKIRALPYAVRYFIVQALQSFAGTPEELRGKYYRQTHGAYELGIGDIGRLLVDVNEKKGVVEVLDFKGFL